jgi:hypothetical protein
MGSHYRSMRSTAPIETGTRPKAYITGYMVEDLVIMWCKLRFVDLTTRLAEATQV